MERIGKYEVQEVLGRGGMGVVYKAIDPAIGRTVALKVLPPGSNSAESRERFLREARAAGRLQHPNIVVIHDLGEEAGSLYIAMEYLEGRTLADRVAEKGAPDIGGVLELMAQVARGLHYAHERGVVHRDIKPANILVTNEGLAKILDFGIARAGDQRMTKTGQVMGTVFYMSPEQINGQAVDGRSDVFSAGVVLYELLTGDVPFEADSTGATMMRILTAPTPPLSARQPLSPPVLDEIIARALAKKAEDRYASAAEFAQALTDAKLLVPAPKLPATVRASSPPPPSASRTVPPQSEAATVVHQAERFPVVTSPQFVSDLERASAESGAAAARALESSSIASTVPVSADAPWRWWHLFWPTGASLTGAKVGCRFSAGVALLLCPLSGLLLIASLDKHGTEDVRLTLVGGIAFVSYAFCGALLLRYSRIAAVGTVLLAAWMGFIEFVVRNGHANLPTALIATTCFLMPMLPALRGAFLHHRLRQERGIELGKHSRLGWTITGLLYASLLIAVVALFLVRNSSVAVAAVDTAPAPPVANEVRRATYNGTLTNHDVSKTAPFWLSARWFSDDSFHGCAALLPPLYGSGTVTGSGKDAPYKFTIESNTMTIDFEGTKQGDAIHGTYVVKIKPGVEPSGGAPRVQYGDWSLSPSDPDYAGLALENCPEEYTAQ
jgi:serine/threonine protein kinase